MAKLPPSALVPSISALSSITSIKFEQVQFGYDADKPIFTSLTRQIPIGKNILITGAPGEGTSTFLKLLAVVTQPQSGRLFINEHNTSNMSFEEFLPLRSKLGYTFDYGGLFANRSLLDNLTLPLLYHNTFGFKESRARATDLAEHFGFQKKLGEKPASVTGGLRKLTSVLRTLLMNPEMLVMDDPFMGVDPKSVSKLIKLLTDRRASGEIKHLFLTSRDPNWPRELGCETMTLENGDFVSQGEAA